MTRTSASFTPEPLVATTTPVQQRKCRAVSKRGRPTCQENVNDAKAHSRYRFHSHRPGSGASPEGVDGKAAPNNLLKLVKFSPVFYIFVFSKKNTASLWKEMWETKTVGLTNKTQA